MRQLDKPDTEPANYTYEGLRAFFSTKVFYYPGLPNYGYANVTEPPLPWTYTDTSLVAMFVRLSSGRGVRVLVLFAFDAFCFCLLCACARSLPCPTFNVHV